MHDFFCGGGGGTPPPVATPLEVTSYTPKPVLPHIVGSMPFSFFMGHPCMYTIKVSFIVFLNKEFYFCLHSFYSIFNLVYLDVHIDIRYS